MRETQNKTTFSVPLSADEERTVRRQAISRPYDDISDLIGDAGCSLGSRYAVIWSVR